VSNEGGSNVVKLNHSILCAKMTNILCIKVTLELEKNVPSWQLCLIFNNSCGAGVAFTDIINLLSAGRW
jgi:hypothetical protein